VALEHEGLTERIAGAPMEVHRLLGPRFLEPDGVKVFVASCVPAFLPSSVPAFLIPEPRDRERVSAFLIPKASHSFFDSQCASPQS
jgi:hypothetical protein